MVFNIATAGLIIHSFTQNSTALEITYTEYCLSSTEIALVCLSLFSIPKIDINKKYVPFIVPGVIFFILIGLFNIVFSAFVIYYYNYGLYVDYAFFITSIAIIVTNSINILFGFDCSIEINNCNCCNKEQIQEQEQNLNIV